MPTHGTLDGCFDRAAVALDRRRRGLSVPPEDTPENLGIEPLGECGAVGETRTEDGDHLPYLARRRESRSDRLGCLRLWLDR